MRKLIHKFYVLLKELGADDNDHNFFVHRSNIIDFIVKKGFSERTAINHARPSYPSGMIALLYKLDLIKRAPNLRYRVPSVLAVKESIENEAKEKTEPAYKNRVFEGNPKINGGWTHYGCISKKEDEVQFNLYFKKYKDDEFNLKVAVDGVLKRKANFWMRSKKGKLTNEREATLFKLHHPDAYDNLTMFVWVLTCNN